MPLPTIKPLSASLVHPEALDAIKQCVMAESGSYTPKPISLVASFASSIIPHLRAHPLSEDQVIELVSDGRYEVTATVLDSPELIWFLMGMAQQVEVYEPMRLRSRLVNTFKQISERYSSIDEVRDELWYGWRLREKNFPAGERKKV